MRYTAAHWGTYEIDGEDLRPAAGDPAPSRIGKGWLSAVRDPQSRIQRPAIRRGWLLGEGGKDRCKDAFVEVSWDEAASLVAREITRVKQHYGNNAIYGGSYGWSSAGRFHHAQSQLRRFLNCAGGSVTAKQTYSHAAAEVIMPHIIGMSQVAHQNTMTSWPHLAEHCTLLVAFGGIARRTGQVVSSGTSEHPTGYWLDRLKARQVNISPQKSDLQGAEWLSLRPGTDTALMLALCHTLLDEDLHKEAFLNSHTSGWPRFRAYLLGERDGQAKSADWAAPLCDISPDTIRQLARDMATNETMITVAWGLQRADHGEQTLWAGLALASMLGQMGRPGAGFGFGYSGVGSIGRPSKITKWPSMPVGENPVKDAIPVARIADMLLHPGKRYRHNGQTRSYPDIKLVIWSGGNPFHHHQDLNRLELAWERPETVIVCDHSWTATARRADIVLPATSPLERHDIMMSKSDPALVYMSPVMEPVGEAMDDYGIWTLVADKLGFAQDFTLGRDIEDWLQWHWQGACEVGKARGIDMPDFARFKQMGRFDMPDAYEKRISLSEFVNDPVANPLGTESGKITLFNEHIAALDLPDCPGYPCWQAPVEGLIDAPEGALHLLSPQPDTRLHSQNDRGREALADKVAGREACYLHPQTAKARGLAEGDIVRVHNKRGATLAGLRLDPGLRADCLTLPTGAWYDPVELDGERLEVHGNPNVLTIDKGASELTQANIAHTALVFVEKWDKPLPSLTIDRLPEFVDAPL